MTLSQTLAARVHALETERGRLQRKLTRARQSRDLWRRRALTANGRTR